MISSYDSCFLNTKPSVFQTCYKDRIYSKKMHGDKYKNNNDKFFKEAGMVVPKSNKKG